MSQTRAAAVLWFLLLTGCPAKVPTELVLNRDHLDFGPVEVQGTYRLTLSLSNGGETSLAVKDVHLDPSSPEVELEGGPFDEIPAGMRKVLTVVYRPVSEGPLSLVLHVEADDGKGAHLLAVTGSAERLDAAVQTDMGATCVGVAGSLDFGTVTAGAPTTRQVTVQSTGTGTFALLKATISPEDAGFTVDGFLDGVFLVPGQSSTLTLRYDPTRPGAQQGAITFETNSFLLPRIGFPICGTGLVSALCVTPAQLSFGDVAPGASGTAQLHVSSCGNLPVTLETTTVIPDPAAAAGFSLTPAPSVPMTLDAGQSATLDVRFDSSSRQTARGQVRLTSSSPVTPEVFVTTGANLPPLCNATLGPSSLHFYKDLGATQSVRLSNDGFTDCVIERVELVPAGSDFTLDRPLVLPSLLPAHSSMDLSLSYTPAATAQATTATLQVELDWVHEVALRGDPRPPAGCHLLPQSSVVDFGLITLASSTYTLPLSDVGSDPCLIHGVTFDQQGFSAVLPSTTIAPQMQGFVAISPTAAQTSPTTMTISSNDADHPQLAIAIITGHVRCDPNCTCTANQTPAYWRFSGLQSAGSAVTANTSTLGALEESCDPKRCPTGQVTIELDRGVLQCVAAPPTCPEGLGLELQTQEWTCVPCALIVQFGGLFGGVRTCAPLPPMSCTSGTAPTFDAKLHTWSCVTTCDNGQYDQRTLPGGTLVCVPC